ncbi:MAG: serine/threonine protein kinase [Prevotella sp.]|jgi:serine/threonine protein kinase
MTETKEIKTPSINLLMTGNDAGRDVLVVGLKEAYRDKPQYQRSLKREYAQCHEIKHPNILEYIEEKDDDEYGNCIVMEWEPARTLADYMQEPHSEEDKKNIIRQIAAALNFLHQNGIVHGALTPACIFVTNQGDRVKLLNFRVRYADQMDEPSASLKFRAPEAKDGTVTLDARTDVFSLGMILKEMGLDAGYESVISVSSSFARNKRYPDINTFLDAFEHRRYTRMGEGNDVVRGTRNKRVAMLIATVVGLAVIAALVYFNRNTSGVEGEQPMSEMVDSTQTDAQQGNNVADQSGQPAEDGRPQAATPKSPAVAGNYTGDLAFLNELVPQMHIDLDKIYASGGDDSTIHAKVARYYRGLRKVLGNKTEAQFAAYDKEFADYVNKKNAGK